MSQYACAEFVEPENGTRRHFRVSKEELALYYEAHSFLGEHGFNTVTVENGVVARKIVAGRIIHLIFQLI